MKAPPSAHREHEREALHAHQVALLAVATLAELRESDTESHLIRVQHYVRLLAVQLHAKSGHPKELTHAYIDALCAAVTMYELGTVGVPDRILLKPAKLTSDEVAIMRTHTTLGYESLVRAEKTLGVTSPMLTLAKDMCLSHHEKWNGRGYPQSLEGESIPLSARILALADTYDALISNKVYRQGISHAEAVQLIFTEREAHFDPDVVDAFMEIHPEFHAVAEQFADTDADMQRKIEYMANAIAEPTSL